MVDAAPDRTTEAGRDVSTTDVVDAACTPDANLLTLDVPDAAIGDSGASTGRCVSCLRTNCQQEIGLCNANCECNGAVVAALGCLGQGGGALNCFAAASGGLGPEATQIAQAVGFCILAGCQDPCGAALFFDGGGRPDSATDATGQ